MDIKQTSPVSTICNILSSEGGEINGWGGTSPHLNFTLLSANNEEHQSRCFFVVRNCAIAIQLRRQDMAIILSLFISSLVRAALSSCRVSKPILAS